MPKSGMVVLPRSTHPASRTRAEGGASEAAGVMSAAAVPTGAEIPLTAMLSLMVIGTPSSKLSGFPARHLASDDDASASAPAASTTYMALIFLSHAALRSRAARDTSTGESCLVRYDADNAWAERSWSLVMAIWLLLHCPRRGGAPTNRQPARWCADHHQG